MKKQNLFIVFALFLGFSLYAQKETQKDVENMDLEELDQLCVKYRNEGDYDKSIFYTQKRADLAKSMGIDSIYVEGLNNLAVLYFQAGKYDNVIPLATKSLAERKKIVGEWHPIYALNLNNLATFYWVLGKYENAEPLYLQALAIQRKALGEEHPDVALCLNNLSKLYNQLARFDDAVSVQQKCVDIYKKTVGEQHRDYAVGIESLALLYQKAGKLEQAEPLFEEAIMVRKTTLGEEHEGYGTSLRNLGEFLQDLKKYDKAESLYLQALDIYKKTLGDKHPDYMHTLEKLASLYTVTERYELAEKTYLQALAVEKKIFGDKHSSYASCLKNLAEVYFNTQKYPLAKSAWEEVSKINLEALGKQHPDYIKSLINLARFYEQTGDFETSKQYFEDAIKFNTKTEITSVDKISEFDFYSDELLLETLVRYARLLKNKYESSKDKGLLEKSYLLSQSAIKINERIRNGFSGEKDKLRSLSQLNKLVTEAIEIGLKTNDDNKKRELFSFAELNKSVLLADASKAQRARSIGDLPDSLAIEEMALQERYDKLKKKESEAKSEEQKQKITTAKNELNAKIEAFKKDIKNKYPKYHALKYENITAKTAEIQSLLDEETLFLEYFIADENIYLFVLEKKDFQVIVLPINKKNFAKDIKSLRKALSDYDFIKNSADEAYTLYTSKAYSFYKELLAPALKGKNVSKLIIVTDGELGHIPFEAFLTEEIKTKKEYNVLPYLLNSYKVSYSYSATLWKENMASEVKTKNGLMLAFAASYKGKEDSLRTRANRAPHLRNLRDALQSLPAAKQEVEALGKAFSGDFLFENNASEKTFKEKANKYGVIHLAMHGILNQRAPILSSLAFTENGDSTEDNFLEAWEISHLKLNAQLVVLSACETGYGKFQQGEGVMSLARAFMYAGVPSLVVSLWQVNDASTSTIMQLFYKNLAKGMDKAEALQKAKLDYIKTVGGGGGRDAINRVPTATTTAAHPAFWAAFIIIGDSRPMAIATKGGGTLWYIVGGIGLLAVVGGIFALRRRKHAIG